MRSVGIKQRPGGLYTLKDNEARALEAIDGLLYPHIIGSQPIDIFKPDMIALKFEMPRPTSIECKKLMIHHTVHTSLKR